MKHIARLLISLLPLLAGCNLDDAHYVLIEELDYAVLAEDGSYAKDDSTAAVPAEGGVIAFRILSNADVKVTPRSGIPEWAKVNALDIEKDSIFRVEMQPNNGFRRGVVFDLALEGSEKTLELVARQHGVIPVLECADPYVTVKGSADAQEEFVLNTNLVADDLSIEVSYMSGDSWITSTELDGTVLKVSTIKNPTETSRKAAVTVSHLDGWNIRTAVTLFLTQASSSDAIGTPATFAEVRAKATPTGTAVEEEYTVTGIVISDWRSSNMAENRCIPIDEAGTLRNTNVSDETLTTVGQVVDTLTARRTAYIESEDAALGFRLLFDEAGDNILEHGTRITLSLAGTVLYQELDPERYTIAGVKGENIMESTAGIAVPVKEKTISELTDEDVYTYVGVKNVEFPVKEGSYTDVRENHALWSVVNDGCCKETQGYFYMDGFSNMLVDGAGHAVCTPVNMLCEWRKPASGIPQGAGTAYGIITHEDIIRYGDAGRYQLRVLDDKGFAGLASASNWTTLAGWDMGKLVPSHGDKTAVMVCEKTDAEITKNGQHSYKSVAAGTNRTCGISDTYRSIEVTSPISGWYNWKDGKVESYNGMRMEISTEGISGSQMMVAFRFYAGIVNNADTYKAFPSHWCVDYSLDGKEYVLATNADLSGQEYVHLRNIAFTKLSMAGYSISTTTSTALGASVHAFTLPAEVFGKDKVYVRIRPYDTVASALPAYFDAEVENSQVKENSAVVDYVSFQDVFVRYR